MSDPILPNGFTLAQTESCIHRGKKRGVKSKGTGCSCNKKNVETLYACKIKGSCTLNMYKKDQSEQVCSICPSVEPKEGT